MSSRTSDPDKSGALEVLRSKKVLRRFCRTEQEVKADTVFKSCFSTRKSADNLAGNFQQIDQLAKFAVEGIETIGSMDKIDGFSPGDSLLEAVFFIFSQGLENLVRNAQISGRRREGSHACCGNAGCDSVENRREINLSPRIGTCRTNKGTEDLYGIEKNDKRMFSQLYLAETQVIQETFQVVGKEVMQLRDSTLPLLRLESFFNYPHCDDLTASSYVVVVGEKDRRVGIIVNDLLGQQDIVIKALGETFKGVRGVAGAADLGDQRTILILDVSGIVSETTKGGA